MRLVPTDQARDPRFGQAPLELSSASPQRKGPVQGLPVVTKPATQRVELRPEGLAGVEAARAFMPIAGACARFRLGLGAQGSRGPAGPRSGSSVCQLDWTVGLVAGSSSTP